MFLATHPILKRSADKATDTTRMRKLEMKKTTIESIRQRSINLLNDEKNLNPDDDNEENDHNPLDGNNDHYVSDDQKEPE